MRGSIFPSSRVVERRPGDVARDPHAMTILDWLNERPELLRGAALLSLATFLASLIGLPLLVAALPADYFALARPPADRFGSHHPLLRWTILVLKNVLGVALLACGVAMLVLPGQGILTVLVGLSFMNFPRKRRLELAIVRHRRVRAALDWIRRRAKKPTLIVFDPRAPGPATGSSAGGGSVQSDRSSPSA
jgi:hypothetical protein